MYEKSRQKKSYFLQVLKDNIAYKYIVIYYDDQSLTHINTKGNTMLRKTLVRTNPKILHFIGKLATSNGSYEEKRTKRVVTSTVQCSSMVYMLKEYCPLLHYYYMCRVPKVNLLY